MVCLTAIQLPGSVFVEVCDAAADAAAHDDDEDENHDLNDEDINLLHDNDDIDDHCGDGDDDNDYNDNDDDGDSVDDGHDNTNDCNYNEKQLLLRKVFFKPFQNLFTYLFK